MLSFPISVSAVALDLDGTLVDTLPDLHEASIRMLSDMQRPAVPEATVKAYIGDGVDRLVKRLLTATFDGEPDAKLFERAIAKFRDHYATVLTRASRPFPGAITALEKLQSRGFKLACVTNKPARFTEPLLAHLGLDKYLDLVLSGDSLPRKKPDPLQLQHAAQCFSIVPTRLLMIGDSPVDVEAARAAGCPVFCVPYGYRGAWAMQALDCDAIVPTLVDSLDLIRISHS
ncbi:MAG: phosphoglycolate phosphatase [Burkholderiales bacterium]|jgi:phosphoglycolate phosphatase